jgi:hypothetical protein
MIYRNHVILLLNLVALVASLQFSNMRSCISRGVTGRFSRPISKPVSRSIVRTSQLKVASAASTTTSCAASTDGLGLGLGFVILSLLLLELRVGSC